MKTNRALTRAVYSAVAALSLIPAAALGQDGPATARAAAPERSNALWYAAAADDWMTQALPIGNGRLGAMVFGGVARERLQFNEDSLWIGDENDTGAYQAFGDLTIELRPPPMPRAPDPAPGADGPPAADYCRRLDLETGVLTVAYRRGGVQYRREFFASHPAGVIVIRFTADRPGSYSGAISLTDAHHGAIAASADRLEDRGNLSGFKYDEKSRDYSIALRYNAQVVARHEGGMFRANRGRIEFRQADSLTLYLDAGTDYASDRQRGWRGADPQARVAARLLTAAEQPYELLRRRHIHDYQSLYRRVQLDLGAAAPDQRRLPTDQRLLRYTEGARDPELEALIFQYGRYLLICSSRDALPANLQGIWNDSNRPLWRSDYHTDVNVEMNYWPADVANLSDCFPPLFRWVLAGRAVHLEQTRAHFHARGWTSRAENGIFGGSTWEWIPAGSAWLCQNLWDHYAFTQDRKYLTELYPVLKEVCEFWEDELVSGPGAKLVAPPDFSPEHGPVEPGISFDQELVWDLFSNYIEASQALGKDGDERAKIIELRSRLLGPRIGRWGQLQEWMTDRDDPTDTHRHVSHLVGLYPGRQISPRETPALAQAAKVSLEHRGDLSTGWAMAWRINLWARLLDGEHAYKLLRNFIRLTGAKGTQYENGGGLYPNLFCAHPPFQIDGNFGACAGVAEMLVQSRLGAIDLLPALPSAWPNGQVRGLRARGGFVVDLAWREGKLAGGAVRSLAGNRCRLRYRGAAVEISARAGGSFDFDGNLKLKLASSPAAGRHRAP